MNKNLTLIVFGAILSITGTLHAGIYTNTADINNDHRVYELDALALAAEWLWS